MRKTKPPAHEAGVTQRPGQLHGSCSCGWVAEAGHPTRVVELRPLAPLPWALTRESGTELRTVQPGNDREAHAAAFRDARAHVSQMALVEDVLAEVVAEELS